MSSDDGWVIRNNAAGQYVLQHWMGDNFPDVETPGALRFGSLEEAVLEYQKRDSSDYPSEYGLKVIVKERGKMSELNIEKHERKPFDVDTVLVTAENMEAVAKWCGGEVVNRDGNVFIKVPVDKPMNEKQTEAHIGDRVLFAGKGYKVYTRKAFENAFQPKVSASNPSDHNVFDGADAAALD